MEHQTKLEQVMVWEAPAWLRCALAFQDLTPSEPETHDLDGGDSVLVDDHPLGFV